MTRRLVVLGAGTAGTMIVNKLRRKLSREEWEIDVEGIISASDFIEMTNGAQLLFI